MKKRHNWNQLRVEYLSAETMSPTEFLRERLGGEYVEADAPRYRQKTKGWKEDKEATRAQLLEIARIEAQKNIGFNFQQLLIFKWNIVKICGSKLKKEGERMAIKDLKLLWEMIKAEIGEVTEHTEVTHSKPFSWVDEK